MNQTLRAARLVLVPETEPGRHWAEARIKTVTGGERIRAKFMHRDHFEFVPQFKLLVAGNHRPALPSVGEAMRRRLHMVPFTETIPPENRDPYLTSTLLKERDGILGWMLEGCADWQKRGLAAPDCITEAANDYFRSEDLVGQRVEECCATGHEHRASAKTLYQSWKAWAEDRGIAAGSQKSLGEALRSRGFGSGKVCGARGWIGISVARRHPDVEGPA